MIRNNYANTFNKQFDLMIDKQGVQAFDYFTHKEYQIILKSSLVNESMTIYYLLEDGIKKGDTLIIKGINYLITTQTALDGNVMVSLVKKCDSNVIVYGGTTSSNGRVPTWYYKVPCVVSSFSGSVGGDLITMVSGKTSISMTAKEFLSDVEINNEIIDFDGNFIICNKFKSEGIIHYYLEQKPYYLSLKEIGILYFGDVKVGHRIPLKCVRIVSNDLKGYARVNNGINYIVSNTSVADITEGILSIKAKGEFVITVTDENGLTYTTPTIKVTEDATEPYYDFNDCMYTEIAPPKEDDTEQTDVETNFYCSLDDLNEIRINTEQYARVVTANTNTIEYKFVLDDVEYTHEEVDGYINHRAVTNGNETEISFEVINEVLSAYTLRINIYINGNLMYLSKDCKIYDWYIEYSNKINTR